MENRIMIIINKRFSIIYLSWMSLAIIAAVFCDECFFLGFFLLPISLCFSKWKKCTFICLENYGWLVFNIDYMQSLSSLSIVSHTMHDARLSTPSILFFATWINLWWLIALPFWNEPLLDNISGHNRIHTIDP